MSHYFINDPNLKSEIREIKVDILETSFIFDVDYGIFSQKKLDLGTRILIENVKISEDKKTIIDMGCGYGPIAIVMANKYPDRAIFAYDINERAVRLTNINAKKNNVSVQAFQSNLFSKVKTKADVVISNPPIRTGKQNIFQLYEEAFVNLNQNGELWIVIRNQQGANSSKSKLIELFGNCESVYKKKGYQVLKSVKTSNDQFTKFWLDFPHS